MNKKIIAGAALTFLLTSPRAHATQSFKLDSTTAIRVIGAAAALGGIYSVCAKKKSTLGGLILLAGGASVALGADRIVEEFNRHVAKSNFFEKWLREAKHRLGDDSK